MSVHCISALTFHSKNLWGEQCAGDRQTSKYQEAPVLPWNTGPGRKSSQAQRADPNSEVWLPWHKPQRPLTCCVTVGIFLNPYGPWHHYFFHRVQWRLESWLEMNANRTMPARSKQPAIRYNRKLTVSSLNFHFKNKFNCFLKAQTRHFNSVLIHQVCCYKCRLLQNVCLGDYWGGLQAPPQTAPHLFQCCLVGLGFLRYIFRYTCIHTGIHVNNLLAYFLPWL